MSKISSTFAAAFEKRQLPTPERDERRDDHRGASEGNNGENRTDYPRETHF